MHITFVKKQNPDGSSCGKCEEVEQRLERDGHMARIDEVAIADLADPDSRGMQLAQAFDTAYAPFFIVREGDETRLYTIYLKFVREVLEGRPPPSAQ